VSRPKRRIASAVAAVVVGLTLTGCSQSVPETSARTGKPLVVTTSAIAADLAARIGGDDIDVQLLVPNGFDSHTYEPKPSELALLGDADLIVLPDASLNGAITGLVELSGDVTRVLDLNAAALDASDLVYREQGNASSANPHTWTSPILTAKWLTPLTERIVTLNGVDQERAEANVALLLEDLRILDTEIRAAFDKISSERRKLVVYHDAWEYFGREYGVPVIGAIQAASFAEPSAAELSAMAKQIRDENVTAFFGSEVFPSDVLEALESETGARYIPDLADDRLPGEPGMLEHSYIGMMRANLALLIEGLSA
jgi:ABC-type Zn uptake system ZnuABC Zn-binding protein ZnuA